MNSFRVLMLAILLLTLQACGSGSGSENAEQTTPEIPPVPENPAPSIDDGNPQNNSPDDASNPDDDSGDSPSTEPDALLDTNPELNKAPELLGDIPSIEFRQFYDSAINLSPFFSDPDDDVIRYQFVDVALPLD